MFDLVFLALRIEELLRELFDDFGLFVALVASLHKHELELLLLANILVDLGSREVTINDLDRVGAKREVSRILPLFESCLSVCHFRL